MTCDPGHVGTVADERVDPIDISATLIDLAVHGHLRITELPRDSEFAATDWSLTRTDGSATDLHPFEEVLLDGVVGHDEVKVSELSSRVYETVGGVQDKLYDEVVARRLVRAAAGRHPQPVDPDRGWVALAGGGAW